MDILNINPTILILQAISFLLVLIILKMFLFKPVQDLLDARRSEVEEEYGNAEGKLKAAEDLQAQYQQRLASVEDEMRAKIAEAVKEGQAMREEIISDSRAQAEDIVSKAKAEIARERDAALINLKTTVADLTVNAAGKLINEKLDDPKHRELIGQFISDLDGVSK